MRSKVCRLGAAAAVASLLCACSSGDLAARNTLPTTDALQETPTAHNEPATLYVANGNAVEILKNRNWKEIGTITDGLEDPFRGWVDAKGNLYEANISSPEVTEYAPGTHALSFTYSNGMGEAVDVATDRTGNVYEADQVLSTINEYPQGSNTIEASCGPGAVVESVAVDGKGYVFVAYQNDPIGGQIVEYKNGLRDCSPTVLGVTFEFIGGIALDAKNDLIVCDQGARQVDIVKPPYKTISGTFGRGLPDPITVRINKKNDLAYVSDEALGQVIVLKYPSGLSVKVLNSAAAGVDSQNFNP
jgi:hypothetical protein